MNDERQQHVRAGVRRTGIARRCEVRVSRAVEQRRGAGDSPLAEFAEGGVEVRHLHLP
jgi:hypothetical protein